MGIPTGVIDLDTFTPMTEKEIIKQIRQGMESNDPEDQKELMEIAKDLFTNQELKILFGVEVED
jgi:hypothetical protein